MVATESQLAKGRFKSFETNQKFWLVSTSYNSVLVTLQTMMLTGLL